MFPKVGATSRSRPGECQKANARMAFAMIHTVDLEVAPTEDGEIRG